MTFTEWWSFIAGTIGCFWAIGSGAYLLYRNLNPWDMRITIKQIGNTPVAGYRRETLIIKPGKYIVELTVVAKRDISSAIVCIVPRYKPNQCKFVKETLTRIRRHQADWSRVNITHAPRNLLSHPLENCTTDDILQIEDVEDNTPFVQNCKLTTEHKGNMWLFNYDPKRELNADQSMTFTIRIIAVKPLNNKTWKGVLEFSSVRPIRRNVKIGDRTIT